MTKYNFGNITKLCPNCKSEHIDIDSYFCEECYEFKDMIMTYSDKTLGEYK